MSTIPSNLARVPLSLSSSTLLNNMTRTSLRLLQTQVQMSTGKQINSPSDDPVGASRILGLQNSIDARAQYIKNLDTAGSLLNTSDNALSQASQLTLQARDIASSMIGLGGDATTRANQAQVIDSMLSELVDLANSNTNGVYLFGGQQTSIEPIQESLGGYRYTGTSQGQELDLGTSSVLPVTMPAPDAFGGLSSRVQGDHDLNPDLTGDTRLTDLNGARGLGVTAGTLTMTISGIGATTVDLSGADSVQDVIDAVDNAIAQVESANSVTILGPGRVGINSAGDGLALDVAAGYSIDFSDIGASSTAADLGLSQSSFSNASPDGADVDPKITMYDSLADLPGYSAPLSDFVINNAGQSRTISMTGVNTVQDLANAIKAADIGVRLEIDPTGQHVNLVNELSGSQMSAAETVGGNSATFLGIRSFTGTTKLSDFNNGRGVDILSGNVDPVTGLPDPTRDVAFQLTLSDGTEIPVDLAGAQTVQDVLDIINTAGNPKLAASLTDGPNGITLTDSSGGSGTLSIEAMNGSTAAQDLGILKDANGATIAGDDTATIEVDSVFSHLVDLRNALLHNDDRGITFAGESLSADVDRMIQARGLIGQRTNRADTIKNHDQDRQLLDQNLQSQIQDLDFTEVSVRFSTLQAQMQATMIAGSQSANLSLIQFLG